MTLHLRRPSIDVDTETLKAQAADLGATIAEVAGQTRAGAGVAAAQAVEAAGHAKEWTAPKVEAFVDWLLPRVEHLYKESVIAAAPRVEKVAERATPAIGTAHDKLVDELLPRLVLAVNAAADRAADAADAAGAAATAAVTEAAASAQTKKHTGAKIFWVVAVAVGIGAAVAAWNKNRSTVDPWAEPWEPSAPEVTDSFRSRAHEAKEELSDVAGQAAETVGEVAGATVAKSRQAAGKVAEAADDLGEKVAEAAKDLTEKVAEARDTTVDVAKKATRRAAPKKPTTGTDEPA